MPKTSKSRTKRPGGPAGNGKPQVMKPEAFDQAMHLIRTIGDDFHSHIEMWVEDRMRRYKVSEEFVAHAMTYAMAVRSVESACNAVQLRKSEAPGPTKGLG